MRPLPADHQAARAAVLAMTVATRGRSRRTASSPMWSPASYVRMNRSEPSGSARSTRTAPSSDDDELVAQVALGDSASSAA